MISKICTKCKQEKTTSEFYNDKTSKDKLSSYCKKCSKEKAQKYGEDNKKEVLETHKKHWLKTKDNPDYKVKRKESNSRWISKNKAKISLKSKEWNLRNPSYMREYQKKWAKIPSHKIQKVMGNYIYILLKKRGKEKDLRTKELLGCTFEFLKEYLENKFQPGMSWENYGLHGWHVDHIIPCASFDLTNIEEQKKCFHYTNLQPLWAKDNLSKGSKLNWVKNN